jgi:AraC-like DNA-binding protein
MKWPHPDPVVRATLSIMSNLMQDKFPSVRSTAALLNLQVRTLQRHLRDWGTTFEQLLDDSRRERAFSLLGSGEYTITESAFLLGYSDAAHFTRAFRRWTGMSPRTYVKAQNRGSAEDRASMVLWKTD